MTEPKEISWKTRAYGRESDLMRLNNLRNNTKVGPLTRLGADRSHTKICLQLRDSTLNGLRERLIRATIAGDQPAIRKIELQIRDYLGEEKLSIVLDKD